MSILNQKTINNKITFCGIGLHTGKEVSITISESSIPLTNLLKESGMTSSASEAMRMIKQGAVRINEEKITDTKHIIDSGSSAIYQVGKRKFKKITL